jgi:Ni2+-binding GTPase involved in maturation of urease and hydrogenase
VRLVTFAGPPSSGKTSAAIKTALALRGKGFGVGAVKFDCIATDDDARYRAHGIPALAGISGNICPDHYYVTNIEDCLQWARAERLSYLFSESAGLCNRCSPHIKGITAVCVIDCLSGLGTPKKVGPMLMFADIAVLTKGDIVSPAEREVFALRTAEANRKAQVMFVNGLTGEGALQLATRLRAVPDIETLRDGALRFPLPVALCSYCYGETRIGDEYYSSSYPTRKMKIPQGGDSAPSGSAPSGSDKDDQWTPLQS